MNHQPMPLKDQDEMGLERAILRQWIEKASIGISSINTDRILQEAMKQCFNGMQQSDLWKAAILSARSFVEEEPHYSYVASRLLLNNLYHNAQIYFGLEHSEDSYSDIFITSLHKGIELGLLTPQLQSFQWDQLKNSLKSERDLQFNYLGLQTLYDRYLLRHQDIRFELPQVFFMRVAMGLAIKEKNKEEKAIEFYELLSNFDFMCSTPTLFNAGTPRAQLSSGCMITIPDNLSDIFDAIKVNALLSSVGAGIANDWTNVRAMGSIIQSTNGASQGVIPYIKVANDASLAVNQGGKRKGAICAYLETWHLDIEQFLNLRKNTGEERFRAHETSTANWIPDLFMKRVFENKMWTLFSPNDVPDLHDAYGLDFETRYLQYEEKVDHGEITHFKRLSAVKLWQKMLSMLYETGHPWITFKDTCNIRSPQSHLGVIHCANLCTEVVLNTSPNEIASCNLGTVNLAAHMKESGLDIEKLHRTVKAAVRLLNNIIDVTEYSVKTAEEANQRHRPIGIGIMGFQDALYRLGYSYQSAEAIDFADSVMEHICYAAISASCDLAYEFGSYDSFAGSFWSKGILPLDSIQYLQESRGAYLQQDSNYTLNWDDLRKRVRHGIRNSTLLSIAPTATISNICGVSQSIEPSYSNLFVKSNASGEFTIVNQYLVSDLKQLQLWDNQMLADLKQQNGSVQMIDRIPTLLKNKYRTAFEIDQKYLIEAASRRQKWIDQSQSFNLYIDTPSGTKLDQLYRHTWLYGLKTCYYLRSKAASHAEKSTITDGVLNAVKQTDSSEL